jgi:tetratricopeptide (TPR) repeat protein
MQENRSGEFYDEVLRALWGYVGDKLNIPVAQLSQDNIRERLSERNVDDATIAQFTEALNECEFERYAPGDAKGNMNKVYTTAMTAIENIESVMKRSKKNKGTSAKAGLVLLLLLMPAVAGAVTKAEADSAYAQGNYQRAISCYEALLKEGKHADVYYNLGNAYYRIEDFTHAILNYERALLLSPADGDVKFNLQMARSKTVDKIVPESEMFFVTWYHSLVNLNSVDGWARLALITLALAIVLALAYLFSSPLWMRKVGFYGAVLMVVVFLVSNLFAYQQKSYISERRGAIIMSSAVSIKSTPAENGTDLFVLHEGTKVVITDSSMDDWKEIRVADGKRGWIETSKIEMI